MLPLYQDEFPLIKDKAPMTLFIYTSMNSPLKHTLQTTAYADGHTT